MTVKTYDERTFQLACDFVRDEPGATRDDAHELALEIQSTIEDWLNDVLPGRLADRKTP